MSVSVSYVRFRVSRKERILLQSRHQQSIAKLRLFLTIQIHYCEWYSGAKITEYKESGVRLLRYLRIVAAEYETRLGLIGCEFSCRKLACCVALDVEIARSGRYGTGIHTQSR